MNNNVNTQSKKTRRTLRSGSYTAVVCVVLVAILVFANLILAALPSEYILLDMTANGIYSVGDTSRQLLDTITDEINIYLIYEEGNEDPTISGFLERYSSINSNIKVSHVDPGVNPNFASQYTDETLYDNSLIVVGPKRNTVVQASDMYKYYLEGQYMSYEDYYTYNYYMQMYYGSSASAEQFFFGEQEITSAIDYVTTENIPVMYYTSKHGEAEINSTYTASIADENIDLKELDLVAKAEIPADAEAIIINAPTNDFTEDEVKLLQDYMNNGGDVVFMTNFQTELNTKMPNLAAMVNALGLTSVDGLLVEGDSGSYSQMPYITLPSLNATSAPAQIMKSTNVYVYMMYAHGIEISDSAPYVTTPILTSSDQAYIKPGDAQTATKEEGDPEGEFYTGVHVSLVASDVQTTVTDAGSFVWYSSNEILNTTFTNSGNGDLFTSTLNTMCAKTSSISIIGKSLDTGFLTIDGTESVTWQIVLTVVIPVAVLACGLGIWYKRRHR